MEKIAHYCQKCRHANEAGEVSCRKCGTRLMLVVFPPSIRHEESVVAPSYYEDHLLERVSLLELHLAQVTEQLKLAYEFIRREADAFQKDHALLQSFFETLEKVNPDLSDALSEECLNRFAEKKENLAIQDKQKNIFKEILTAHGVENTELFSHLVREGIKLLGENEEKQAFRNLERASLLSAQNVPLLLFIAENLFRADKFDFAEKYLEKAFEFAPQKAEVLLFLGAILADKAETKKARKLLSVLANEPKTKFCVNFIWGMLAAFEKNWNEAIAAFKQSLENTETPEIHYLLGCANFQIVRADIALPHLQKAVLLDAKFADAWFMQSVIYAIADSQTLAQNTLAMAFDAKEAGAQCLEFLRENKTPKLETALPFAHFENQKRHILTKGSLRLNNFFRSQIFKSIE